MDADFSLKSLCILQLFVLFLAWGKLFSNVFCAALSHSFRHATFLLLSTDRSDLTSEMPIHISVVIYSLQQTISKEISSTKYYEYE
jgi:hypothetical protein